MTIDYELVVSELREDLENLAKKDAEFRAKVCEGLNKDSRSDMVCQHRAYVTALDDALKATAERYHVESKQIFPKFGE